MTALPRLGKGGFYPFGKRRLYLAALMLSNDYPGNANAFKHQLTLLNIILY